MTRPGSKDTTLPNPFWVDDCIFLSCSNWPGSKKTEMRIEMPQQARDGALKERLLGLDGVGGILLQDRVSLNHRLHSGSEVVVSREGSSGAEQK